MATNNERAYTAGRFAMDLGGTFAGWISSIEGGHATSDVVVEKLGADKNQQKHIAGVKYEDITVACGTGMSKAFYKWIQASLRPQARAQDGAIITADYDYKEQSRLNFFNALITEVGFPALDAASKDAAKMTIKFAPEYTRMQAKARRPTVAGKYAIGKGEQKKWLPVELPPEDRRPRRGCTRVNKIEAITVKQKVVEDAGRRAPRLPEGAGAPRDPEPRHHARRVAPEGVLRVARGLRHQGQQRRGQGEGRHARVPDAEPAGRAVHPHVLRTSASSSSRPRRSRPAARTSAASRPRCTASRSTFKAACGVVVA